LEEQTMNTHTTPKPLAHLTAVHLLGRILERLDHQRHATTGRDRYQTAMQQLARALDHVEHTLMVRQVMDTHSGT
jgi:hypothetical protein